MPQAGCDKNLCADRLYSNQRIIAAEKEGDELEVIANESGRRLTLSLRGELDHHGAGEAMQRMEFFLDAALPEALVLDFSGVSFMDSSGIAVVIRAQKRMRLLHGGVSLRGVPPQAKKVFAAAGIFRMIPLEEGEKDENKTR